MYQVKKDHSPSPGSAIAEETVGVVELCADQINVAVEEAAREIDGLTRSVLNTTRFAGALLGAINENPDGREMPDSALPDSDALQQIMHDALVHLQFADRLNQRLMNVSTNLAGLAEFIQSAEFPLTDVKRAAFLAETRATFTIRQERQMFDAKFGRELQNACVAAETAFEPIIFDGDGQDGK